MSFIELRVMIPIVVLTAVWLVVQVAGASAQSVPSPSPQPSPSPSPAATAVPPTSPVIQSAIRDLVVETRLSSPGAVPTVRLTWSAPVEFSGAFQIERARLNSGSTSAPHSFALVATVSTAARTGDGQHVYEEPDLRGVQSCFRARTLVGEFAGPYTGEVCTVNPLPTGPGSATPSAPKTGGGEPAQRPDTRFLLFGVGPLFVGSMIAGAWARIRTVRGRTRS